VWQKGRGSQQKATKPAFVDVPYEHLSKEDIGQANAYGKYNGFDHKDVLPRKETYFREEFSNQSPPHKAIMVIKKPV
jgi:hypothetical protein